MDTARTQLRNALAAGLTMDQVDYMHRQGRMSDAAHWRYYRLWATTTATEDRYTQRWGLDRWRSRRDANTRAVRAFLAA